MKKFFVCMAKSWKHGNYCVAGKEVVQNKIVSNWFRPVFNGENNAIPGSYVNFDVADIVSCEVESHCPAGHQTENYLLSGDPDFRVIGSLPLSSMESLADHPRMLWKDGFSSVLGVNDKLPCCYAGDCKGSLYLIRLSSAVITSVVKEGVRSEYLQRRVLFNYNGLPYNLAVTDPQLSSAYGFLAPEESRDLGPCLLTISLGEPYAGSLYKLAAGYISL